MTAKDEESVIYIKTVDGKLDSLDRMEEQRHEGSRAYARKMKQFLSDPNRPDHLLDLSSKYLEPDAASPTFYHIGRFISGVRRIVKGQRTLGTLTRSLEEDLGARRCTTPMAITTRLTTILSLIIQVRLVANGLKER